MTTTITGQVQAVSRWEKEAEAEVVVHTGSRRQSIFIPAADAENVRCGQRVRITFQAEDDPVWP